MEEWTHNGLLEDLAIAKGTNFMDLPLGSVVMESPQRADVIEVKPSYTRFCVSIYEVKVSRADFLGDLRRDKWRGYLPFCHRFYFAVPAGMVNIKEIPAEAGLIVRGANGWKVMRSVKARSVEIPSSALMSMIFARERSNFQHKRRDRLFEYDRWKRKKQFSRELGQNLADALRHKDEYFEAKEEFEYLTSTLKESIREALGIETSYPTWELNKLLRMIKQKAGQN